jgi:hypothetical protein
MIDFTPFCDATPCRYDLSTPWTHDGWTYATDGRICIRVPASLQSVESSAERRPRMDYVFHGFDASRAVDTVPQAQIINTGDLCGMCYVHPYEDEAGCRSCFNTGLQVVSMKIGPLFLNPHYIAMINALGPARYYVNSQLEAMAFVADSGLQGLLKTRTK